MAGLTSAARNLKTLLGTFGIKRSEVRTRMMGKRMIGEPRVSAVFVSSEHYATVLENAEEIAATGCTVYVSWHKCGQVSNVMMTTAPGGVQPQTFAYESCTDCTEAAEQEQAHAARLAVDVIFHAMVIVAHDHTEPGEHLSKRHHALIDAQENADQTMRENGKPAYYDAAFTVTEHGTEWAAIVRASYATLACAEGAFAEELPTEPLTAPVSAEIKVGDKVSFKLSDSRFESTGTVTEVKTLPRTGAWDTERKTYVIKDNRPSGWTHQMYAGEVRKVAAPQQASEVPTWDGMTF